MEQLLVAVLGSPSCVRSYYKPPPPGVSKRTMQHMTKTVLQAYNASALNGTFIAVELDLVLLGSSSSSSSQTFRNVLLSSQQLRLQ